VRRGEEIAYWLILRLTEKLSLETLIPLFIWKYF
jgi:hypothetical protein